MIYKNNNSSLLQNQAPVKRKLKKEVPPTKNIVVSKSSGSKNQTQDKKLNSFPIRTLALVDRVRNLNLPKLKLSRFDASSLKQTQIASFIKMILHLMNSMTSRIFKTIKTYFPKGLNLIISCFSKSVGVLLGIVVHSVGLVARYFFILLARWMRIHGSHGVPSVGTRRLRMVVVVSTLVCMGGGVMLRLYALQGLEFGKWDKLASKQHGTGVEVEGARGLITDRNGLTLAVSIPALSIGIHPKWIKSPEKTSHRLANILEMSETEVLTKIKEDKNFTILKRGVSMAKRRELEDLKLYGLEVEEEFNRIYPQGDLAATIIGKAGRDGMGLSGVERALNPSLTAPAITLVANRDAKGRLMNAAVWNENKEPNKNLASLKYDEGAVLPAREDLRKEGASISLTLDSTIQRVLEEEFDNAKNLAKAKDVFGLMMDAETGEILAMGQTVRYNPNDKKSISPEALRNVVLQNSFEPGSTFKPIVAAIALDQGLTSKDELINCENGKFHIGRRLIRDAHPIPTVTFEQVIVRSSNIGMAKLGFRLGKENLYNSLYDWGFGQQTGLELSGESTGIMRNHKSWAQIDIATHSYGQGVSVTALQLVRAYGALANGGLLIEPKILRSDLRERKVTRLISEKSALTIQKALNLVTEDEHGTGKNSRIAGVPVYGKTGTAQKARTNGRGYDPDKILASFIGFVDGKVVGVPRKLVLYVAVDEPGVTPRWGGTLAAPVFKAVMERTLSHFLSQTANQGTHQYVRLGESSTKPLS